MQKISIPCYAVKKEVMPIGPWRIIGVPKWLSECWLAGQLSDSLLDDTGRTVQGQVLFTALTKELGSISQGIFDRHYGFGSKLSPTSHGGGTISSASHV